MGKAAKVLHGREHRVPAADGYDTQLQNTVFLLLTAMIRNFYKFLMGRIDAKAFGLEKCSRIKAYVFKFFASKAA